MKMMFPDLLRGFQEKSKENSDGKSMTEDEEDENSIVSSKKSEICQNPPNRKEELNCHHCEEVFENSYLKEEHFSSKHPEMLKYPCCLLYTSPSPRDS